MKRKLPIKEIHGTPFYVDVEDMALKQLGDSDNVIYFSSMEDKGSHYEFPYDLDTKTMPGAFQVVRTNVIKVEIEQMARLDPQGMALKYGKTLSEVSGKSDYEVIVDQKLLEARKANILPVLDINNDEFYVDVENEKLIALRNPDHQLFFSGLSGNIIDGNIKGFYHVRRQEFIAIEWATKVYPTDVVYMEIPYNYRTLDPIYTAKAYSPEGARAFLCANPPKEKLVAKISDIRESYIADIVNENIRLSVLPKYEIHGTSFFVDIENNRLVEEKNPANTISFNSMTDKRTYYEMDYDTRLKSNSYDFLNSTGRNVTVTLPQMKDLDPERMAKKYGLEISELRSRSDFEIMVNQELLKRRKEEFPILNIAGTDFQVNIVTEEFKNLKAPYININVGNLDFDEDTEILRGLYDTKRMQFVNIDMGITAWPKDTVYVELPRFDELDPVRYSRYYPEEMEWHLRLSPLKEKYVATVLPRNESPVLEVIQRNIRYKKDAVELAAYKKVKKNCKKVN